MSWIRKKLKTFGEQVACHEAGRAWSYQDFLELIDHAISELPTSTGQIIEVQTSTTIKGLAKLLAIAERQHIALPLPAQLPETNQIKMRKVATESPLYDQLKGSGLVLFSSGTSGEPKGMLHNFDALLERYKNLNPRTDRSLLLLLIDHIGGLDSAFRCLLAGSTLVVPEDRTPQAAATAIEVNKVNVLPASPTFLNLMLLSGVAQSHDLSTIEIIAYGAEAMPTSVLDRLADTFPKAQLQQKFGTSETGAIRIKSAGNKSLFFQIKDEDTQWKVINDELWLKTPSRILGYLNAANDSLEADGWYATGDLVETDSEDNLRIIGRVSSLINIGGQKVHPSEIETVLNSVPGITGSRVFGKPAQITGHSIACEITTSEDKTPREWKRVIRNHCRGNLATWQFPSKLTVVESFSVDHRLKQQ